MSVCVVKRISYWIESSNRYMMVLRCFGCVLCLMRITSVFFFFNDTATTEIYTDCHTLALHDALPIFQRGAAIGVAEGAGINLLHDRLQPAPDRTEILDPFFPAKPGVVGRGRVLLPALQQLHQNLRVVGDDGRRSARWP